VVVITFDDYARLVRARRTSMMVDRSKAVPLDTIERLCEIAQWAPNHKRTWPLRFAHCTGEGRARLGDAFVEDMIATSTGDAAKREKTKTKYLRAPSIVVVGCAPPVSMNLVADDRDAVAAGIQTLLLGATALGLASFWSTAPVATPHAVNALCGFEAGVRIVGVVYLGWPVDEVDTPNRPPARVTQVS
jgi:nitroreductase